LDVRGEEYARQTPLASQALRFAIHGDHRAAGATIEALHREFPDHVDANLTMRFAWVYTLAAAAVWKDVSLREEDKRSLVDSYHTKVVKVLSNAQRVGYFRVNLRRRLLQSDPILAPLRDRPDFSMLLSLLAS